MEGAIVRVSSCVSALAMGEGESSGKRETETADTYVLLRVKTIPSFPFLHLINLHSREGKAVRCFCYSPNQSPHFAIDKLSHPNAYYCVNHSQRVPRHTMLTIFSYC